MTEPEKAKMTTDSKKAPAPLTADDIRAMIASGELALTPEQKTAFRRSHEIVRKYVKPGSNIVDQFIADRRKGLV